MTDKKPEKPVTLADYIPPESEPAPKTRGSKKSDRDRLKQLEREASEEKRTGSPRKKRRVRVKTRGNKFVVFLWVAVLVGFALIFGD